MTDGEAGEMERILVRHTGIPEAQAAAVVRLAGQQARRSGGTDDFVITREFDRVASHEQKIALIDALFTVSSVDASIVTIEDNEIRRIANELKIEHRRIHRRARPAPRESAGAQTAGFAMKSRYLSPLHSVRCSRRASPLQPRVVRNQPAATAGRSAPVSRRRQSRAAASDHRRQPRRLGAVDLHHSRHRDARRAARTSSW